jgi:cyclohexa-1,5-dienecarbonyl-CoA hydratase
MASDLGKLKLLFEHDGRVARLVLNAPRANVIDADMMASLQHALAQLESRTRLRAIVLGAEGPHFSFGASIEEHLPEAIEATLKRLHALLHRFQSAPAPTVAVVQGRCLGGGLELALACDLILAEEDAVLACPEIQLGVFAPAASALLPLRVAGGHATRSLLTGSEWDTNDALAVGLVDRTAPEGERENTLQEWLSKDFLPRSAAGLKHAALASRWQKVEALENVLPRLERAYLSELGADPDGFEGIRAFLEKRSPQWQDERSA